MRAAEDAMSGLLRLKYLTPDELAKVRSVMNDPTATRERRADAELVHRIHLSLNGIKPH